MSRAARRDGTSVEAVLDSKKETKEIAEEHDESSEETFRIQTVNRNSFFNDLSKLIYTDL